MWLNKLSQKTQVCVSLLKKGTYRLYKNVMDVNPQFVDDLLLKPLLTTEVENLHAVSHFEHETFKLQYTYMCTGFWNNLQGIISGAHIQMGSKVLHASKDR